VNRQHGYRSVSTDLGDGAFEDIGAAANDDDTTALRSKRQRDASADASAPTGEQTVFSFKPVANSVLRTTSRRGRLNYAFTNKSATYQLC